MPARNPTGAATRSETSTTGSVFSSGCQPPHQRKATTIPRPIAPKSGVIQNARTNPPPSRWRRHGPCCGGATGACCSCSTVVAVTGPPYPSLTRDQIVHERVELRLRHRRERLRHQVAEARLDVGARIDDRGMDERRQRLLRLPGVLCELVQVGADLPRRAGRRERVAAAASVVLEDERAELLCVSARCPLA